MEPFDAVCPSGRQNLGQFGAKIPTGTLIFITKGVHVVECLSVIQYGICIK